MKRILNFNYGAVHGAYWMLYGVATGFSSALLLAAGYSNGEIGMILAAGSVIAVFLQPLIADFADRSKKISLTGVTEICTIISMILYAGLFVLKHQSAALFVCYALILAWVITLQPLLNSLCFRLERSGIHINFGVCRSVGSMGYSILCSVLGTLVENHGVSVLPAAGELTLAALLIALLCVKRNFDKACGQNGVAAGMTRADKTAETSNTDVETAPTAQMEEPVETLSVKEEESADSITLPEFIRGNKLFIIMQMGIAGIFFSNAVLNNFMLQVVSGVGGNSEDMGRVLGLMAFLEIPALMLFDKIHDRFSCQTILRFASVCFILKVGVIYLAQNMMVIYLAHLLQPFSFGLFLPGIVAFTNETMRKGEAVKGQAWFTVMTTLASVISSILGGIMLDTAGDKFMLLVATLVTAAGAAVIVLLVGRIKKK